MVRVEECLNSVGGVVQGKETLEFRKVVLRWRLILLEDIYCVFFIRRSYIKTEYESQITSDKNGFIMNRLFAGELVNVLQKQIIIIRTAMDNGEGTDRIEDEDLSRRVQRLDECIKEMDWRIKIIDALQGSVNDESIQDLFVAQMLSSPTTLLLMALRKGDLSLCKEIIAFWKIESPESEQALLAERLSTVSDVQTKSMINDMDKVILQGVDDVFERFILLMDCSISKATTAPICDRLLIKALTESHTQQWNGYIPQGVQPGDFEKEKNIVLKHLDRLQLLANLHPEETLNSILTTGGENAWGSGWRGSWPMETNEIREQISKRKALISGVAGIKKAEREYVSGEQGALQKGTAALQSTLLDLIHALEKGTTSDCPGYLAEFVAHLLSVGNTLAGTVGDAGKHLMGVLQSGPRETLAALVFGKGEYDKAEKIAELLGVDLVSVILASLGEKRRGRELEGLTRTWRVTMKVIEYLANRWTIVAALACILRGGLSGRIDLRMIDYALIHTFDDEEKKPGWTSEQNMRDSKNKSASPVHNWVRMKARMVRKFANVFLRVTSDKVHVNIWEIPQSTLQNESFVVSGSEDESTTESESESDGRRRNTRRKFNRSTSQGKGLIEMRGKKEEGAREPRSPSTGRLGAGGAGLFSFDSHQSGGLPSITNSPEQQEDYEVGEFHQLNKDQTKYYGLLMTSDDVKTQSTAKEAILEKLIGAGRLREALEFADDNFDEGAPDSLLKIIIEREAEERFHDDAELGRIPVWNHIIRLKDARMGAVYVLKFLNRWDIAVCIDMLSMCKYRLVAASAEANQNSTVEGGVQNSKKDDQLVDRIEALSSQMVVFNEVLIGSSGLMAAKWRTWQSLAEDCKDQPAVVVRKLMECHLWAQARQIAELFTAHNMKREIEESRLIDLLVNKNDTAAALQALAALDKAEVMTIVRSLIEGDRDSTVIPNATKLFLVQYLLSNLRQGMSPGEFKALTMKELGLKALMLLLPKELQNRYQRLMAHPALIVESLLMAEQVPQVSHILMEIPSLREEKMIINYAKKALFFSQSASPSPPHSGSTSTPFFSSTPTRANQETMLLENPYDLAHGNVSIGSSTSRWMLTGDEITDTELRNSHYYPSAPNINLGKSLLDLLGNPRLAGKTALDLCDILSAHLRPFGSDENLHSVNLIQQLVLYAKLQFSKDSNSSGISLCDTILSHVELLQSLIISKCDLGGDHVSLMDFSDPKKSRLLRDRLISQDMMKMAIDLATKCNIESEPVWAVWGISLLKIGRYNDAKEKFKYCLSSGATSATSPGGGTDKKLVPHLSDRITGASGASNRRLLNQIIELLESGPPVEAKDLREMYTELASSSYSNKSSRGNTGLGGSGNNNSTNSIPVSRTTTSSGFGRFGKGAASSSASRNETSFGASLGRSVTLSTAHNHHHSNNNNPQTAGNVIGGAGSLTGNSVSFDSVRFMQCVYYLKKYGSPRMLITFWSRHDYFEDALNLLITTKMDKTVFVEEIFQQALLRNKMAALQRAVLNVDSTFRKTSDCLYELCKELNNRRAYKVLLSWLLLMNDYVRAGLACLKLFQEESSSPGNVTAEEMERRCSHLEQAKEYFVSGLNQIQQKRDTVMDMKDDGDNKDKNGPVQGSVLSESEVGRYMKMVTLQLEISRFFFSQLTKVKNLLNVFPSILTHSLFGNQKQIGEIAVDVLLMCNFDLGFRIVMEMRLPIGGIYSTVMSEMAKEGKKADKKMSELLKYVKGIINDKEWDAAVLAGIRVFAIEQEDYKMAEKYIGKLVYDSTKIESFLMCRKFRQAYMIAVKNNNIAAVEKIRDEAKKIDPKTGKMVAEPSVVLCEKFLAQFASQCFSGTPPAGMETKNPSSDIL
eukprot:TRINITY_DN5017_c0_g1_i1.p1 TRINITY_DN5017_c0_g1~~TRINITY_DN5017_c0_g1_i1.p1  ORF type:complete len:2070 (+),score=517.04 TRINITY_DN5017_c0_g1_i1:625-6210(+)